MLNLYASYTTVVRESSLLQPFLAGMIVQTLRCSTNAARALRNHCVTIVAIPTCPLGLLDHLLGWRPHT